MADPRDAATAPTGDDLGAIFDEPIPGDERSDLAPKVADAGDPLENPEDEAAGEVPPAPTLVENQHSFAGEEHRTDAGETYHGLDEG